MNHDEENRAFNLASEVVQFTGCNLFLTGKAGTGKTTFLKYIREHTPKNTVVVAPTGVAAINAGGVTMHSFFQLPFLPFLPKDAHFFSEGSATVDRHTLIKNLRLGGNKLDIIREMELLIIDEVSMLRADMLDAIDEILRHFRQKRSVPFGGVQVLFIGDLYQLPPVVKDEEWSMMKEVYESPFFFSAQVIKNHPPLHIELKKIYRQKEEQFIELLNNIRNNTMGEADFKLLQGRFRQQPVHEEKEGITLTSHNYMADKINLHELQKLATPISQFNGEIKGDFSDKNLPAEMKLSLKEGAQVMFVKNDSDPAKRYFNGKLASVTKISEGRVTVKFVESEAEMELEKEKWSNIRYVFNKETDHIEEEELGSFTQYPVRLAWAITIHKSQGLTFDRVVIDAGSSFAAGQVYVALSRCRTLDGISLLTEIRNSSLHSDERIVRFSESEHDSEHIQQLLDEEKPMYASKLLLRTFEWGRLVTELERFDEFTGTKKFAGNEMIKAITAGLVIQAEKQKTFADKFIIQLEQILREKPVSAELLQDRVVKAKTWFVKCLNEEVIAPFKRIREFLTGKPQVRQYLRKLDEMEEMVWKKLNDVQRVSFGAYNFEIPLIEKTLEPKTVKKGKQEKGSSKTESLNMYKQGMSVADIAKQRTLSVNTIENHLSEFVITGEVNVFDFISKELLHQIQEAFEKTGTEQLTPIKQLLGDEVTYVQVKFGLNYLKQMASEAAQ